MWTGLQWGHAAHGGSSWIVWLWAVGLISLGFVLVHPLVGLLTYLVMAFSIHGAGNYYWVLHRQGVLHWALVLAFVGCVLWRCRYENKVWLSADLMTRCILVLIIWVFVCHIVALIGGRDEPPRWNRQPVYFIHCLLTFWLASCLLRTRQQLVLLFGVIAGTLLFRWVTTSPESIYKERYFASYLVIAFPLLLSGALVSKPVVFRILFALSAVVFSVVVFKRVYPGFATGSTPIGRAG